MQCRSFYGFLARHCRLVPYATLLCPSNREARQNHWSMGCSKRQVNDCAIFCAYHLRSRYRSGAGFVWHFLRTQCSDSVIYTGLLPDFSGLLPDRVRIQRASWASWHIFIGSIAELIFGWKVLVVLDIQAGTVQMRKISRLLSDKERTKSGSEY